MSDRYVYGIHAVAALMANPKRLAREIFVSRERADERILALIAQAEAQKIAIKRLSHQEMKQSFDEFNHQGIVALAERLPEYREQDLVEFIEYSKKPCLILILDGITDPHNLGACLRTADAVGVDFVVIPKDKSASVTPVVSKVASGAAETIPIISVTNLARAIETLKEHGVWIYGAAGEAETTLYDIDYRSSIAMVMGAEGKGLRRLTKDHCDQLFSLPMHGTVSSLNVSVATGIALYEVVRQRRQEAHP